jgi:hypothetical protein
MDKTTNEVEQCRDCGRPKAATLHEANDADYCAEADCAAAMRSKNNFLNSITAGAYAIDPKARASVQDVDDLVVRLRDVQRHIHEERVRSAGCVRAAYDTIEQAIEALQHRADSPAVSPQAGDDWNDFSEWYNKTIAHVEDELGGRDVGYMAWAESKSRQVSAGTKEAENG